MSQVHFLHFWVLVTHWMPKGYHNSTVSSLISYRQKVLKSIINFYMLHISLAKAASTTKNNHFSSKLVLKFKEETSKVLHLEHSILWCWKLDTSESTRWFKYDRDKMWLVYTQIVPVIFEPPCISETSGKVWHVVLEKEEEEQQLFRSCEKWGSSADSQGEEEYRTENKKEEDYLDWSHLA
jgi:hypothetical protein